MQAGSAVDREGDEDGYDPAIRGRPFIHPSGDGGAGVGTLSSFSFVAIVIPSPPTPRWKKIDAAVVPSSPSPLATMTTVLSDTLRPPPHPQPPTMRAMRRRRAWASTCRWTRQTKCRPTHPPSTQAGLRPPPNGGRRSCCSPSGGTAAAFLQGGGR
jgi:hypothetical protein